MPQRNDWVWEEPRKETRGNYPNCANTKIKIEQEKTIKKHHEYRKKNNWCSKPK